MQYFTSSISGKKFPLTEKVSGQSLRQSILELIQKDCPGFSAAEQLSFSELNEYRNKYILQILENEAGRLNGMDQQLGDAFPSEDTFSAQLMERDGSKISYGDRLADKIASFGGSWTFIISFLTVLVAWICLNAFFLTKKAFDPYPFILLNLVLSCVAALQAPVIMMSQNRQEAKDRNRAKNDYLINLKSELEVRMLHQKIDHLIIDQQKTLFEIQQVQIDMMNDILDQLKKK